MGTERLFSGLVAQDVLGDDSAGRTAEHDDRQKRALAYAPLAANGAALVDREGQRADKIDGDKIGQNKGREFKKPGTEKQTRNL